MAAELLSPDALKLGIVAFLGLGYAAYKAGLVEKFRAARGVEAPRFRPRPVFQARKIRFSKVVLDVCGIDQLQLIRTTARLRRMGFWVVGDFALPISGPLLGSRQRLFARALVHGEDPVYALIVERRGLKAPPAYVDFFTLFTDQTFLTVTNSDEEDDPKRPAALRFHRLSGLLPEELYQHHRANLEALRNNWMKAVPTAREAFFSHFRQWLVVDSELRKSRDEEVRKDQITRSLDSLPPLDIGPILKRYDGQRTPYEFAHKSVSEREIITQASSPTVIRDPERAPIRRRLPPSGPAGTMPPRPSAAAVPMDPTYGDELISSPGGFAEMAPDFRSEPFAGDYQAHPLDMLDRLDSAILQPTSTTPPEPQFDYGLQESQDYRQVDPVLPQDDRPYYQADQDTSPTRIQEPYILPEPQFETATAEPAYDSAAEPAYESAVQPAFEPAVQPAFEIDIPPNFATPSDAGPQFSFGDDLGTAGFMSDPGTPGPMFVTDLPDSDPPVPFFLDPGESAPSFAPEPGSPPFAADLDAYQSRPIAEPLFAEPAFAEPPVFEPEPPVEDIHVSLRHIQSWRPPEFPPTALESEPTDNGSVEATAPEVDAPERCPHCQARSLSRYSQRCHKCRKPLLQAQSR